MHWSPTLAPTRTALACFALSAALGGLFNAASAQDWVSYVDETSTRLVAAADVGSDDTVEKDLISGDVDGDGDLDLIVARKVRFSNPGGLRNVLFMNELGVMTDRTATLAPDFLDETDDRDVILADFNGDGWLDVVTATTFADQPRIYMNRGAPGGTWLGFEFQDAGRIAAFSPPPKFCAVAAGDVNGDNRPDLFFVDYDNDLEDRLLINDGTGFFTDETDTRMSEEMSESVFGTDGHIVDLNGDGFLDIVKNSASGSNPPPGSTPPAVRAIYNDGTGFFDFMELIYTDAPYMIEPADLNNDDRVDVFVIDDGQDAFLLNDGNDGGGHAMFTTNSVTNSPNTSFFGGNVKVADLDADGILDVAVADVDTDIAGCDRTLTLLRGQGTMPNVTYSDPLLGASRSWLTTGTFDIEIFDIDHDGNLDIWAAICDGNRLLMGEGAGIFTDGFESGATDWWTDTVGE